MKKIKDIMFAHYGAGMVDILNHYRNPYKIPQGPIAFKYSRWDTRGDYIVTMQDNSVIEFKIKKNAKVLIPLEIIKEKTNGN